MLGFPQQPFAFLTTFWVGIERGFNGYKHNTTRYMKDVHCPVLMQWGTKDALILKHETPGSPGALQFNGIGVHGNPRGQPSRGQRSRE